MHLHHQMQYFLQHNPDHHQLLLKQGLIHLCQQAVIPPENHHQLQFLRLLLVQIYLPLAQRSPLHQILWHQTDHQPGFPHSNCFHRRHRQMPGQGLHPRKERVLHHKHHQLRLHHPFQKMLQELLVQQLVLSLSLGPDPGHQLIFPH